MKKMRKHLRMEERVARGRQQKEEERKGVKMEGSSIALDSKGPLTDTKGSSDTWAREDLAS